MPDAEQTQKPTEKTYRLLYAKSGNRCAFPNCNLPVSDGRTLLGQAAHIKAEKPGGPRYDAKQTSEERRSFENLILLCPIHHKVVDDDPDAYTVEHLVKMKGRHEAKPVTLESAQIEEGTRLLVQGDMNITAINPQNSITAGIVHQYITNQFANASTSPATREPYQGVTPKEGLGRYRTKGQPLGKTQSIMPFDMGPSNSITLRSGPLAWVRLLPTEPPGEEVTFKALEDAAGNVTLARLPTLRGHADYRFTGPDGIGRYLSLTPGEAYSATFLFRCAEIWSVDAYICLDTPKKFVALSEMRKRIPDMLLKFGQALTALNIPAPYRWIIGLEGVEGYSLAFDRKAQSYFQYPPLMTDSVLAEGFYTPGDDLLKIVDTFSQKAFAECGMEQPPDIL
jgi:hypothetical protein